MKLTFPRFPRAFCVCLFMLSVATHIGGYALGQAISEPENTPIPKGYKTWSLFLINNPQWLVSESNDKIKKLHDQFQAFGKSIGPDHLAVWFWSNDRSVDVIRSEAFCQKLKLSPGDGPYILVTSTYPGAGLPGDSSTILPTKLQSSSIVYLNNKSADEVMRLLTQVADKITADRLSDLNSDSEEYWRGWERAYAALRDVLANWHMSVVIKTPLSEVEIK